MKRIWLGSWLFLSTMAPVLVLANEAEVVEDVEEESAEGYKGRKEITPGVAVSPFAPFRGSVSLGYRPTFGVGMIEIGNANYVSDSRWNSGQIEGVDFSVGLGYWSNMNKADMVGWHFYMAMGSVYFRGLSRDMQMRTSAVSYKKWGFGLDIYPFPIKKHEITRKRVSSIGVDLLIFNDENFYTLKDWNHYGARVTYRIWFSR